MGMNIVICSDGTGNTFDGRITNVTRLVRHLALDRPDRQVVRYDQGVGTTERREEEVAALLGALGDGGALRILSTPVARKVPLIGWVDRVRGLLFGYGLKENVRQLYRELAQLYDGPDDHVFLFGFSRGAFTVRALAGLLHRCHLPNPVSADEIDDRFERAWRLYQPMLHSRLDQRPCPTTPRPRARDGHPYCIDWPGVARCGAAERRVGRAGRVPGTAYDPPGRRCRVRPPDLARRASALAVIGRAVRGGSVLLDLTAEAEDDLVLAVSEAGSNVIDHAYRTPEVAAGISCSWIEPAVCSPSRSSIMAGGSLPARTRRAVGWTST